MQQIFISANFQAANVYSYTHFYQGRLAKKYEIQVALLFPNLIVFIMKHTSLEYLMNRY